MVKKKGAAKLAKAAAEAYEKVKGNSKPGSGKRFKALSKALEAKGAETPEALAAWIGRQKYGKERFQKMAAKGRGKKK